MKKMIMMMVATMMMATMSVNAKVNNSTKSSNANVSNIEIVEDAVDFEMNINTTSLSRTLDLSAAQDEAMGNAVRKLSAKMKKAGQADASTQSKAVTKAINGNLGTAYFVLDAKQYHTYATIINMTLKNKGLDNLYK